MKYIFETENIFSFNFYIAKYILICFLGARKYIPNLTVTYT